MTIAVILEGGLVQCVVTDDPAEVGKEVEIINYDTEGAEPIDMMVVPQGDGTVEKALVHTEFVELAGIGLNGIRELTRAEEETL